MPVAAAARRAAAAALPSVAAAEEQGKAGQREPSKPWQRKKVTPIATSAAALGRKPDPGSVVQQLPPGGEAAAVCFLVDHCLQPTSPATAPCRTRGSGHPFTSKGAWPPGPDDPCSPVLSAGDDVTPTCFANELWSPAPSSSRRGGRSGRRGGAKRSSPLPPTPQPCQKPQQPGEQLSQLLCRADSAGLAQSSSTLMLQNLSHRYSQETLLGDLTAAGFGPGLIDFVYLPFHFGQRLCQGYAFVNFRDPMTAGAFIGAAGSSPFGRYESNLRISLADRQGRAANVERLRRTSQKVSNPRYMPLVLEGEEMVPLTLEPNSAKR